MLGTNLSFPFELTCVALVRTKSELPLTLCNFVATCQTLLTVVYCAQYEHIQRLRRYNHKILVLLHTYMIHYQGVYVWLARRNRDVSLCNTCAAHFLVFIHMDRWDSHFIISRTTTLYSPSIQHSETHSSLIIL